MEIYMVKCLNNLCRHRWKMSEIQIDDGREVVCPKCGFTNYILDATDEIDGEEIGEREW